MSAVKRRILCAEANEDVGDLIALLLGQKGYEVGSVQTIADCLRAAATGHFDLYLVNDQYIDGDSIELCQQLRALNPSIPVLLFSLESSKYEREKGLIAGGQVYVTRTSDFASLVQAIDTLLQSY